MTRDEILNMQAGREMDALIEHHIFGRTLCAKNEASYIKRLNGYEDLRRHKPYSTDIGAARKVVEEMTENFKCDVSIANRSSGNDCPRIYVCRIQYGTLEYDNPDLLLYVVADTAPLAICRAALLAVMK